MRLTDKLEGKQGINLGRIHYFLDGDMLIGRMGGTVSTRSKNDGRNTGAGQQLDLTIPV